MAFKLLNSIVKSKNKFSNKCFAIVSKYVNDPLITIK